MSEVKPEMQLAIEVFEDHLRSLRYQLLDAQGQQKDAMEQLTKSQKKVKDLQSQVTKAEETMGRLHDLYGN